MEAASVGRTLGNRVGYELKDVGYLAHGTSPEREIHPLEIGMIVAAATLAHDIGNPPFGHSGEDAIRTWFRTSPTVKKLIESSQLSSKEQSDFENFEGNAQGFRILARLQMYKEYGGLRLTYATLGAFMKYPAEVWTGDPPSKLPVERKKFGFFQSEADIFRRVASQLGLVKRNLPRECWARHPLSLLVEAADDICYRLVDFEDAVQQKLIPFDVVKERLLAIAQLGERQPPIDLINKEPQREQINHLRALAIGAAIHCCTMAFIDKDNHTAIINGDCEKSLIAMTECSTLFEEIEDLQRKHVFNNERVLRVEAAGFRVIGGLLEAFFGAACDVAKAGDRASAESRKLFALLPDEYKGRMSDSAYTRLQRVTDYICGMTDRYAVELYRNILGTSLP